MDNKIGEIRHNKFGTLMEIIAYRNIQDMDIEFLDKHHYIKRHVTYSNFKRGCVKNPFDRSIDGNGYVGIGKHNPIVDGKDSVEYITWKNMIKRCYCEKRSYQSETYYLTSEVSEDWKNFQNFADWYDENKYECEGRLHLDKDILYPGNKIYSPYHCLLVPQRINMLFTNKQNKRGLPNGIKKDGNKYYAKYNSIELGSANTIEEAYEMYAKQKKEEIIKIANEYRKIIPDKVYEALLNYEIRIENDKNYLFEGR